MNDDKNELIIRAKNGDKKSLEYLLKKEEKNIIATLYYLKKDNIDINDLTQDILVKINNHSSLVED